MRPSGNFSALAVIFSLFPAAIYAAGPTSHRSADTGARLLAEALTAAGGVDPVERNEKQRHVLHALDRSADLF